MHDVVVIGAGAMGAAAAWQLTQRGHEVTVLERFEPGHTRGSSHGASRIFRLAYPDPFYTSLAREAQELWRQLEEESGTDLFSVTGGVHHGHSELQRPFLHALRQEGASVEELSPEEATERWPGLRFAGTVFYQPDAGRLHADHAVTALLKTAERSGAKLCFQQRVTGIHIESDTTVRIETEADVLRARHVVVAVGAWSAKLLKEVVRLPQLTVVPQQPAYFPTTEEEDPQWPIIVHLPGDAAIATRGVYATVTPGEGVKVGFHADAPACDPDARDFQPEPQQLRALVEYVQKWMPGVDAENPRPISCTYTLTENRDFILDRVGPVTVAAGFSGHGFKFTPAIGRILADLVTGVRQSYPKFSL